MDCEQIELLIWAEVDAEIDDADARVLVEHLEGCESCRALAAECRAQDRELREAFEDRRRGADALRTRLAATFARRRGESRTARLASVAAALVLGFALGWVALSSSVPHDPRPGRRAKPSASPSFARLAFATGPVEMLAVGGASWSPLRSDGALRDGSRVRCAPDALCEILGVDGSTIRLDRGSEVRLLSSRSWELTRGRMGSTVARGDTPFVVHAADARVIALGTRFDVSHVDEHPRLHVFEGVTRVETASEVRIVRRGERAVLGERVLIESLQEAQLALASSWTNRLLVVAGRDSTELEHRLDTLLADLGRSKMSYLLEDEIRALGPSCVVPLARYLASPRSSATPAKRVRAARIVSDLATEEAIDDLIELLADSDADVRVPIARALERLTGLDQGLPAESWRNPDWSACEPAYLRWRSWNDQRRPRR